MKNFFGEFKKFITRGNVVDMAVGVIVGGAFTAIVNGMSNFILKPLVNWILFLIMGSESLSDIHTYLEKVVDETGAVDLSKSIYIDWGSFINAVINFFLIAIVLFTIVKIINKFRADHKELVEKTKAGKFTRAQKKELKANGIRPKDKEAAKAYFAEKAQKEAEAAAAKAAADAEAARLDREQNPTTEDLLKQILAEMKKA